MIEEWIKTAESDNLSDGEGTAQMAFTAVSNDPRDNTLTVRKYRECPKRFDAHPYLPGLYADEVSVVRRASTKLIYDVAASYTDQIDRDDKDPFKIIDVSWSSQDYTRAALVDLDGKPFVTTAGEPLKDVLIEETTWVATISLKVPAKPAWFRSYSNAINADTLTVDGETFKPKTMKLKGLGIGNNEREGDIKYREMTFQLHLREDGWQTQYVNRGFVELVEREERDATGKIVIKKMQQQITTNGQKPDNPLYLDLKGKQIENELIRSGKAKVVLLTFRTAQERPFSVFNLS